MRKTKERKPAWLRTIFPDNTKNGLIVCPCPSCGKYVIEDRTSVWERYDINAITGNDLTIAIILDRPLCRLDWTLGTTTPHLVRVCGTRGLDPTSQYIAMHDCRCARIGSTPIRSPRKHRLPGTPWTLPHITDQQANEFEHMWNLPLNQLKRPQ